MEWYEYDATIVHYISYIHLTGNNRTVVLTRLRISQKTYCRLWRFYGITYCTAVSTVTIFHTTTSLTNVWQLLIYWRDHSSNLGVVRDSYVFKKSCLSISEIHTACVWIKDDCMAHKVVQKLLTIDSNGIMLSYPLL